MGKIVVLDELTSNQIAAGEVVERPASVVKEMVENSLDAGATVITVEIENGGISYIRISDNGSGIAKDDMELAFERHATSKIRSADDLKRIASFGFRGEALASVASVAEVDMLSKTKNDEIGKRVTVRGGTFIGNAEAGCNIGTIMTVKDLFYNTPARYKFLKKDYTEAGYVEDIVSKMALINPNTAFKYINSKKVVFQTTGDGNLTNCIYNIYGKDIAKDVIPFGEFFENVKISGALGKAETARANRANQIFFVNGRYVKNKTISSAIENAYQTIIPAGKFPFVVINVEIQPDFVDVNVHPTKTEIRFSDEGLIYRAVYNIVKETVLKRDLIPKIENKEPTEGFLEMTQTISLPKKTNTYSKLHENYSSNKSLYNFNSESVKREIYKPIQERNESLFSSEKSEIKEQVKSYRIIGVVFATYIILERDNEFYIIDQHAAHERVMYEKLVKKVKEGKKNKQMLLMPYVVELSNMDFNIVKENLDMFDKTGFELEEFGKNSFKISAVPSEIANISTKDVFNDLIDEFRRESGVKEDRAEYFIFTMACKAAVKAKMILDIREIEQLIDEMMKLENPFTCPHGRPTAIKMTKEELEKKFKRS